MKTRRHSKFLAGLATGLILLSMFTGPAKAAGGERPGLPQPSGGRPGDQNALRFPVYRITLLDLQKTCSSPSSYKITNNSGYSATTTHDLYYADGDVAYSFMDTISPLASQTYDLSTFSGLPAGYSGYVVVSSTGDISGVVENNYVICGTVNIPGVTISDGGGHSAITDSDGNYTLTGLAAGPYTITASRSGYTFNPTARKVTVPPNAWGQDFTATLAVTETATNTTTSMLTPTITQTLTYSPTVTLTFTPSITRTVTHIAIGTSTYTPTPTDIPSHTPTPSPTPTVTRTNTPTPTKTRTLTTTPTSMLPTGTYTLTPTPTRTVTPASNKIFLPIISKDQSNLRLAGPADDLQGWFQWLWVRLFDQQSPRRTDTGEQADK